MGGGGGSTQPDKTTNTVRYAEYLENHHKDLLDVSKNWRDALIGQSPYSGMPTIEYNEAFFGLSHVLTDFPSLYDMYGKFMAGLDIEILFNQIYNDTINSSAITNRVSEHSQELNEEVEENAIPRFTTGLRDINAVMSSSFVIGKAMLEVNRLRALSKYDATLRHQALPLVIDRFGKHLEWNKNVTTTYAEFLKFYIATFMDLEELDAENQAKNLLWPFTLIEYNRAVVGTLQGAYSSTTKTAGSGSSGQRVVGNTLSGAVSGAMVGMSTGMTHGGIYGAVMGGVLGLATSFL